MALMTTDRSLSVGNSSSGVLSNDGDETRRPLAIMNEPIDEDENEDDQSSKEGSQSSEEEFSETDDDNPTLMMSKERKKELAYKNLLTGKLAKKAVELSNSMMFKHKIN